MAINLTPYYGSAKDVIAQMKNQTAASSSIGKIPSLLSGIGSGSYTVTPEIKKQWEDYYSGKPIVPGGGGMGEEALKNVSTSIAPAEQTKNLEAVQATPIGTVVQTPHFEPPNVSLPPVDTVGTGAGMRPENPWGFPEQAPIEITPEIKQQWEDYYKGEPIIPGGGGMDEEADLVRSTKGVITPEEQEKYLQAVEDTPIGSFTGSIPGMNNGGTTSPDYQALYQKILDMLTKMQEGGSYTPTELPAINTVLPKYEGENKTTLTPEELQNLWAPIEADYGTALDRGLRDYQEQANRSGLLRSTIGQTNIQEGLADIVKQKELAKQQVAADTLKWQQEIELAKRNQWNTDLASQLQVDQLAQQQAYQQQMLNMAGQGQNYDQQMGIMNALLGQMLPFMYKQYTDETGMALEPYQKILDYLLAQGK